MTVAVNYNFIYHVLGKTCAHAQFLNTPRVDQKMEVHRLRFLDLKPKAITCLAFNSSADTPSLAVSRSDASVEIWRYTGARKDFCYHCTIPGRDDSSIECLKWSKDRLFSAGLSGNIHEWKISSLEPVLTADAKGAAIWSMDINRDDTTLAVGCENGQVCLYDISHGVLTYSRTMDKQEGRILSLSWHPTSPLIAVGSSDSTLRVLDTETGHCNLRILLDKSDKQHTSVWCVKFLSDSTIISGSSLGKINVWNSNFGTLKQSFNLHTADVLAMAIDDAEDTLFAAGVDHRIVRLKRVEDGTWVQARDVRPHTHDVRSIAVSRNGIVATGGVDAELCLNDADEFDKGMTLRFSPFSSWNNRFCLAPTANILLFRDNKSLKLWKVSPRSTSRDSVSSCSPDKDALIKNADLKSIETDLLLASGLPVLLLELKTPSTKHIISSAISNDGKLVVFSDVDQLWLYSLETPVTCIGTHSLPARAVTINSNTTAIALCTAVGGLMTASFSWPLRKGDKLSFKNVALKASKKKSMDVFVRACYSNCGRYLMAMTSKYRISLFDAARNSHLASLPRFDATFPPSLTFDPDGRLLIFTSIDCELYSYDIESATLKDLGRAVRGKRHYDRKSFGMSMDLSTVHCQPGVCIVHDSNKLMFMRYCSEDTSRDLENSFTEREALGKKRSFEQSRKLPCDVRRFSDVVFLGVMECGELIVVEKPWTARLTALPPAIQIDRYGN